VFARVPIRVPWSLVAVLATALGACAQEAGVDALVLSVPNPITADTRANLRKRIVDASKQPGFHPHAIIFDFNPGELPSETTAFVVCLDLAEFISTIGKGDLAIGPVETVAYVSKAATKHTVLPVLACAKIVLGPEGGLGDIPVDDIRNPVVQAAYREQARHHAASDLAMRLLDPHLALVDDGSGKLTLAKGRPPEIPGLEPDRVLIDADTLRKYGLADGVYASRAAMIDGLGLRRDHVQEFLAEAPNPWRAGLLDRVAEFFRAPAVMFLLVMFGIFGLILEIKMPGTTVPGTVAALCFVLFFWAHSFVGQFTVLAALLFLLGVAMITIEVFFMPGIAFVGLTGVVLMFASLALVTLDHWPTSNADWSTLGGTMTTFGLSMAGAVFAAMALTQYLPKMSIASGMVLEPPAETPASPLVPARLLGEIGVAVTTLRPSGKAQFGDEFLDVIADTFVEPGRRVQVVEIEGYRIVVKEI
jgi:membrane protein implicated in regulation of membrane protease activity